MSSTNTNTDTNTNTNTNTNANTNTTVPQSGSEAAAKDDELSKYELSIILSFLQDHIWRQLAFVRPGYVVDVEERRMRKGDHSKVAAEQHAMLKKLSLRYCQTEVFLSFLLFSFVFGSLAVTS